MKNIIITILVIILIAPVFAQDDITPPSFTYFSFTPDTVDVTDSAAVVDVTFGGNDDLSGLTYGYVIFRSPSSEQHSGGSFYFDGSLSDTLTRQITIDQFSESGEWFLDFISLEDAVGNYQSWNTDDLDSMGIETSLVVISVQDTIPPSFTYFSFTQDTIDVTDSAAVVDVTFGGNDDLSGLTYGYVIFRSPSSEQHSGGSFYFDGSLSDTLTRQITIDQFSESGEWFLDFISLEDAVGNYQSWNTDDLDSMGIETSLLVNYNLSLVDVHGLPEEYALHQNYPNPFNPTTTLRYDLPEDATVFVVIYDMMGRQVRTLVSGQASAGYPSTMWNATNDLGSSVSAGVYIYTIQAGEFRQTEKMVLLK